MHVEKRLKEDYHAHTLFSYINCHVQVSYTPLGKASREGHSEIVSLLLQEGAHVDAVDDVSYLIRHAFLYWCKYSVILDSMIKINSVWGCVYAHSI